MADKDFGPFADQEQFDDFRVTYEREWPGSRVIQVDKADGIHARVVPAAPGKPKRGTLAGAAMAGATIGAMAAGPVGAAAGAVLGVTLGGRRSVGATAVGGPFRATDTDGFMGSTVGGGQCVEFVQAAAHAPVTRLWKRGALAKGRADLPRGTAIATFDTGGRYANVPGQSHAAILLGQDGEALHVVDQWVGHKVQPRSIHFRGHGSPVDDGNQFYVIL